MYATRICGDRCKCLSESSPVHCGVGLSAPMGKVTQNSVDRGSVASVMADVESFFPVCPVLRGCATTADRTGMAAGHIFTYLGGVCSGHCRPHLESSPMDGGRITGCKIDSCCSGAWHHGTVHTSSKGHCRRITSASRTLRTFSPDTACVWKIFMKACNAAVYKFKTSCQPLTTPIGRSFTSGLMRSSSDDITSSMSLYAIGASSRS